MNTKKLKRHNAFFYSSVCHVCKQSFSDSALKLCAGCKLIVYCSREHQTEHWPDHKDLCKAVQDVRKNFGEELSEHQGTAMLMKFLMEKVQQKLERTLELYEMQMFQYARECFVCYETSAKLVCCPRCMTVWFCAQHKNNHDGRTCNLLKLSFESIVSIFQEPVTSELTDAFMRVATYKEQFSNMMEFINIYGDVKGIQSKTLPHLLEIKQSLRLTKPLTVLYGMRVLNYIPTYEKNKTELVLHVIAASANELRTLREWEILLHVFPNLLRLKLVLIGVSGKFMRERDVCDKCVQKKKSFSVEWHNIPYPQYVRKRPTFKDPDLVIRFYNYNFYGQKASEDLWKSSLKCIAQHNCPVLLSHPHKCGMINNIINTELRSTLDCCVYENPFASLRPNRQKLDGDLKYYAFYENKYLTVYKTLCS